MSLDLRRLAGAELTAWRAASAEQVADGIAARTGLLAADAARLADRVLGRLWAAPDPAVWAVEDAGRRLGTAWVSPPVGMALLGGVTQDDWARVVAGVPSGGWRSFGADSDHALAAAGATVAATEMERVLDGGPDAPALELRPFDADRYAAWLATAPAEYADDLVRSGMAPSEHAHDLAAAQLDAELPDGANTPGMSFWAARDGEDEVGFVWLSLPPGRPSGVVMDVGVTPALQGRGYGRRLMVAAHDVLADRGAERVRLNVFGFNTVARRLYEGLGYRVTSTVWVRRPTDRDGGGVHLSP